MWIVYSKESGESIEFDTKEKAQRYLEQCIAIDTKNGISNIRYGIYKEA